MGNGEVPEQEMSQNGIIRSKGWAALMRGTIPLVIYNKNIIIIVFVHIVIIANAINTE